MAHRCRHRRTHTRIDPSAAVAISDGGGGGLFATGDDDQAYRDHHHCGREQQQITLAAGFLLALGVGGGDGWMDLAAAGALFGAVGRPG